MFIRKILLLILFILCITCGKKNTVQNNNAGLNIFLDSLKTIQYQNVGKLEKLTTKFLNIHTEEKAQLIGKYYKIKAFYFRRLNEKDITDLELFYKEIESDPYFEDIKFEINFILLEHYYDRKDFKKAIALLDRSNFLFESTYSLKREVMLYALSYRINHIDYEQQLAQVQSIILKHRNEPWDIYQSKLHESLVVFLFKTGNKDEAVKELKRLISINKKRKLHSEIIGQVLFLADIQKGQESIDQVNQALKLIRETGHTKFEYLGYRTLGHIYFNEKEYNKAYKAYQKSTELDLEIYGKKSTTPVDYIYMGWALFHVDKELYFKKADSLVDLALNSTEGTDYEKLLLKKVGLTRKSWMYRDMGLRKEEMKMKEMLTVVNYDLSNNKEKINNFNLSSYLKLSSKDHEINELALENKLKEAEISQQKTVLYFWITALALTIFMLLTGLLLVIYFKNKKIIESKNNEIKTFKQNLILENKLNNIEVNIAEDLHDNFGNRITGIISSLVILKELKLKPLDQNKKVYNKFTAHVETNLNSLDSDLKDLMWALNSKNNRLSAIVYRITKMINTTFTDKNIILNTDELKIDGLKTDVKLPKLANKQILLILKEAVNNAIKHSGSEKIDINFKFNDSNFLEILVKDYGKGFDLSKEKRINGINNIKKRAKSINFSININSNDDGTTIQIQNIEPLEIINVAEKVA